jgi:hypothetical protein
MVGIAQSGNIFYRDHDDVARRVAVDRHGAPGGPDRDERCVDDRGGRRSSIYGHSCRARSSENPGTIRPMMHTPNICALAADSLALQRTSLANGTHAGTKLAYRRL